MDPLRFNPMISHSSTHLASTYLKGDTKAHQPRTAPASWRIRLASRLDSWARKLDPELNRTQPTATPQ